MIGVVLAGGLSTRMGGGDKGLLRLGGRPVMQRVVDRLSLQVSEVAINANGDPDRLSSFGLPIFADSIEGYAGPLAGVLAGMDYAAEQGVDHIVTVAADTPFFPADLVAQLRSEDFALAATEHPTKGVMRHPTFGRWPVHLRRDLRDALNDGVRKVVQWTDTHDCQTVEFETGPFDPFFNVNTPEDMKEAERLLQEYDL